MRVHDFGAEQALYNDLIESLATLPAMRHLEEASTKVLSGREYDLLIHNKVSLFRRVLNDNILNDLEAEKTEAFVV